MIPAGDLPVVVTIAAGCALAVAAAGLALLLRLRRSPVTVSLSVVALVPLLAVLTGSVGTAAAMFLSPHDLGVLLVVSAVAGAVGVATALVLGRLVANQARALGTASAALSDGAYQPVVDPLARELAAIDRELAEVSDRLSRARDKHEALENSRRELVAWVSHDLRTPLSGIRAMAEALEDDMVDDPEDVRRFHRRIRVESDRLAALIDDLFELSRIDAGALRLTLRPVALGDLVSDAVASALPVAASKGVRLVGEAPDTLLVRAGVPEMGRVLRNLLANAIRHTPADGVISVQAGTTDGAAYIEVADSCGGIPAEDLPRLFDVSFRGTPARTPGDGGAGLGLAIAKGLVEAHAGDVRISNTDHGCRAVVRLPMPADGSSRQ